MTNDDLKRFYGINATPEMNRDFVRYGSDGSIITSHDANAAEEVVNYRTLIKHAGGPGADLNYKGEWTSGDTIHEYDVVYLNFVKTRIFYMAIKDIASSTTPPNLDTDNWSEYLEVELPRQLSEMPIAGLTYINNIFQYIGATDSDYRNGYFYKCVESVDSYTITAGEDTYYVAALPTVGNDCELYSDITLETVVPNKVLYHMTTGYVIREAGQEDIDAEHSENVSYSWTRHNTQPDTTLQVATTTTLGGIKVDGTIMSMNNAVLTYNLAPIIATGAPTTSTVGRVGQMYIDNTAGSESAYICLVAGATYTWKEIVVS